MSLRFSIAQTISPLTSLLNDHVIKHFFIYSFGSLCLRVVSLIIIPLNMRKLNPSDYGTLSLITSFISIATAVMGLGLRQMLSIEYFHANEKQRKTLINDIITIYLVFAIPMLTFAMVYHKLLISYVFFNSITLYVLAFVLIIIFLSFFTELLYQIMQYERKAFALTILQVGLSLITTSCTFIFLWRYEWGIFGVIIAQLIGIAIGTCIALSVYRWYEYHSIATPLAYIPAKTTYYILNGVPFIPAIIFSWALSNINRWMLAHYGTMHDVGIYAIADLGSQIFYALVLHPWSGSYLPYIMNRYTQNKNFIEKVEHENQKIMYLSMIGLGGLIIIGSIICPPLLIKIFPKDYRGAIGYIWILLVGQVFLFGSYFASALIQFHKKNYFLAVSMVVPTIINTILNILLIPRFNILGCAIATSISYFLYFIITISYQRVLLIPNRRFT